MVFHMCHYFRCHIFGFASLGFTAHCLMHIMDDFVTFFTKWRERPRRGESPFRNNRNWSWWSFKIVHRMAFCHRNYPNMKCMKVGISNCLANYLHPLTNWYLMIHGFKNTKVPSWKLTNTQRALCELPVFNQSIREFVPRCPNPNSHWVRCLSHSLPSPK